MRGLRRLPAWATMVILCSVVLLAAYGLSFLQERQGEGTGPGRPTTYSAGSEGYKVLYLWLKDLGSGLRRWEGPFKSLPAEAQVLLILRPELRPDPGGLRDLEGWVKRGGTLLIACMPAKAPSWAISASRRGRPPRPEVWITSQNRRDFDGVM
jgi:hypothetical protein